MRLTENEIKLAKSSALKDVKIFILEYQKENPDCDKAEMLEQIMQYIDETIDCYE